MTVISRDIRIGPAAGPFDLVLCRNLAFTYFESSLPWDASHDVYRRLPVPLKS